MDEGDEVVDKCYGKKRHCYEPKEISVAEFVHGNANCRVVTRLMLYCVFCGEQVWIDDPDAPELKTQQ